MKKPQLLQLMQKGSRHQPAIYRFGANETLKIYACGRVDICDLSTGEVVREIDCDWLRDWGYSPAKLMAGNTSDQFFSWKQSPAWRDRVIDAARAVLFASALGVVLATVSSITGCTNYVLQQLDKDISTTTVAPVANYKDKAEFKRANQHANEFLAKSRVSERK